MRTKKWQYLTRFSERSDDISTAESVRLAISEYESYSNPLEWVKNLISNDYETAHAGILEMYGRP